MQNQNFKLIVHVGTGKAGSSTIQETLKANQDKLCLQGLKYEGLLFEHAEKVTYSWQDPSGWGSLLALNEEQFNSQLTQVILEEVGALKAREIHTAVWSHEAIFSTHERFIPVFEELKSHGIDVTIIVYLRNHISWSVSAYKQWAIKHKTGKGEIPSFERWSSTRSLSFSGPLLKWRKFAKKGLVLRNFDQCENLIEDFLSVLGVDDTFDNLNFNSSPSDVMMNLYTLFNGQFDEEVLPNELGTTLNRLGVSGIDIKDTNYNAWLPDQAAINKLSDTLQNDLETLNSLLETQSQPPLEHKLIINNSSVSNNQVNAALLMMIVNLDRKVQQLKNQIKRMSN